jgi:hypothetical protein
MTHPRAVVKDAHKVEEKVGERKEVQDVDDQVRKICSLWHLAKPAGSNVWLLPPRDSRDDTQLASEAKIPAQHTANSVRKEPGGNKDIPTNGRLGSHEEEEGEEGQGAGDEYLRLLEEDVSFEYEEEEGEVGEVSSVGSLTHNGVERVAQGDPSQVLMGMHFYIQEDSAASGSGGTGVAEGMGSVGGIGDGRGGRPEGKEKEDESKNGGGGHGGLEGTPKEGERKEEEETKERNEVEDAGEEEEEMGENGGESQKGTKKRATAGSGEVGGGKAGGSVGRGSTGEEGGLGGGRVSEQDGREDGRNPVSPKSPVVLQKSTPLQPLSVLEQVCGTGRFHRLLLTYFLLTYELTLAASQQRQAGQGEVKAVPHIF